MSASVAVNSGGVAPVGAGAIPEEIVSFCVGQERLRDGQGQNGADEDAMAGFHDVTPDLKGG